MKIYSEKKCSQVVSACIDQYPDAMRMPVLECWKKYKLVACIIVLLLSVMLGVATVKTYKDVALFVKNTFSCWRLMVLVIGFLTIIVIETLCICIHEFIHMSVVVAPVNALASVFFTQSVIDAVAHEVSFFEVIIIILRFLFVLLFTLLIQNT